MRTFPLRSARIATEGGANAGPDGVAALSGSSGAGMEMQGVEMQRTERSPTEHSSVAEDSATLGMGASRSDGWNLPRPQRRLLGRLRRSLLEMVQIIGKS